MNDTADLLGPTLMIVAWIFWALCSETRYNHGIWIALLMPLAPLLIPLLLLVVQWVKLALWLLLVPFGNRSIYERRVTELKLSLGLYLL